MANRKPTPPDERHARSRSTPVVNATTTIAIQGTSIAARDRRAVSSKTSTGWLTEMSFGSTRSRIVVPIRISVFDDRSDTSTVVCSPSARRTRISSGFPMWPRFVISITTAETVRPWDARCSAWRVRALKSRLAKTATIVARTATRTHANNPCRKVLTSVVRRRTTRAAISGTSMETERRLAETEAWFRDAH
jgi:hypothetical protein